MGQNIIKIKLSDIYIHEKFPSIGFSSVDAALLGLGSREDKIYFFSGELYTRFDIKIGCFNMDTLNWLMY